MAESAIDVDTGKHRERRPNETIDMKLATLVLEKMKDIKDRNPDRLGRLEEISDFLREKLADLHQRIGDRNPTLVEFKELKALGEVVSYVDRCMDTERRRVAAHRVAPWLLEAVNTTTE